MSSSNGFGRVAGLGGTLLIAFAGQAATAAVDLSAVAVVPLRGQSQDLARRDRYECHNWAVEQTGVMPTPLAERQRAERRAEGDERAERAEGAINGAGAGAAIGGLVRSVQRKNPANGILAGAAIGAAVGAAAARAKQEKRDDKAGVEPLDDYLRALSACLEGRGYRVDLPAAEQETADP